MIIDYSMWRPGQADLVGVNGAIRYLSRDSKKAISGPEMAALHEWGIGTALIFEDEAERALQGAGAGMQDGAFIASQLAALGVPHGRPCYVALDFDIQDYAPNSTSAYAKLGPAAEYLHNVLAKLEATGWAMGVYGGYWAVKRAMDSGIAPWAWQAWPWCPVVAGIPQQDPRIHLYQTSVQVHGGNADLNFAACRDWGQFRKAPATWITGAIA